MRVPTRARMFRSARLRRPARVGRGKEADRQRRDGRRLDHFDRKRPHGMVVATLQPVGEGANHVVAPGDRHRERSNNCIRSVSSVIAPSRAGKR